MDNEEQICLARELRDEFQASGTFRSEGPAAGRGRQPRARGGQTTARGGQATARGGQVTARGEQTRIRGGQPAARGTQPTARGGQHAARGTQSRARRGRGQRVSRAATNSSASQSTSVIGDNHGHGSGSVSTPASFVDNDTSDDIAHQNTQTGRGRVYYYQDYDSLIDQPVPRAQSTNPLPNPTFVSSQTFTAIPGFQVFPYPDSKNRMGTTSGQLVMVQDTEVYGQPTLSSNRCEAPVSTTQQGVHMAGNAMHAAHAPTPPTTRASFATVQATVDHIGPVVWNYQDPNAQREPLPHHLGHQAVLSPLTNLSGQPRNEAPPSKPTVKPSVTGLTLMDMDIDELECQARALMPISSAPSPPLWPLLCPDELSADPRASRTPTRSPRVDGEGAVRDGSATPTASVGEVRRTGLSPAPGTPRPAIVRVVGGTWRPST